MGSQIEETAPPKKDPILSYATVSDIPELSEVYVSAFENSPIRQVMNRGIPRSTLLQKQEFRLATMLESQQTRSAKGEELHFLKATAPDSHEIMALIIWTYLPHGYNAADDPLVQVGDLSAAPNEKLSKDFATKTAELRGENPGRHGDHWHLDLLCTHPQHERKGAASKLVRWAFNTADAEGKRCFVDASVHGHRMYERCGFEDVGEMTVDLEQYEPGCGYGVQRWRSMVREPTREDVEGA